MKLKFLPILMLLGAPFFGSAQQRNCGTMEHHQQLLQQDPAMQARLNQIEAHTRNFERLPNSEKATGVVYTIPVVVHVVYNTAAQNISDAQIQSQIDVLNKDFRLLNPDNVNAPAIFAGLKSDVEINFCLAKQDPNGLPTTGITRTSTTVTAGFGTNDAVKSASTGGKAAWNTAQYLNLWCCSIGGGILGYAQFPGGAAATDGVVIDYQYFGLSGSAAAPYNLGRTATHEVGHWLNLRHIWGDATCGSDLVTDTPTHNTANYGCPAAGHLSTCTGTPVEMTMNYMDYTDDACMYMFTAGQTTRMRALFATGGSRAGFLTATGCNTSTTCGLPSSLLASSITNTSATLGWTAVSGATSYSIQYRPSTSTTFTTVTSASNSYSLTGLTLGTAYVFQVSATCASGSSAYSSQGTFTTTGGTVTCGTPTTLTSTGITTTGATLNWAAVSGASSYSVQYKTSAATTFTTVTSATNTYALSGLTAGTAYVFQVSATCTGGASAYSTQASFTTSTATGTCGTPATPTSSAVSSSGATINWVAVTGASSYNIQYKTSAATTYTTTTSTTTSVAITGLTASTTYLYNVQAVCSGTAGAFSSQGSFTTSAGTSTYCASKGTSQADEWIDRVSLSNLTRTSTADAGYIYSTTTTANVTAGTAYALGYSAGFRTGYTATEFWRIYIDYNKNGVFTDAGETVVSTSSALASNLSTTITIPTTAKNGVTRMRVSMKWNSAQTSSCETFSYGEVEDYNINISGGVAREGADAMVVEEEIQANGLNIYPNPASDKITIRRNEIGWMNGASVLLVDMQGKVWMKESISDNDSNRETLEMNTNNLPNGLYNMVIFSGSERVSKKIVILHP